MTDVFSRLKTALADHFLLEHELGSGGMATVYLAVDLKHSRRVAIKVLRPEVCALLGPDRFLREIEIASGLNHPHIVPLHDSGRVADLLYYVMPYVEGESLRQRLNREQQLPLNDALDIAREVADALAYAHTRGVIHRDIKPPNILLAAGHALVADFGVAHAMAVAAAEPLTATGLAVGTPAYMSPEQALGQRQVDQRSDIYSAGCVLYEMLAGTPPFTGATAQALMARHAADPVPSIRTVRPAVPEAVEEVVGRALAKAPADRFGTAHELADALNAATRAAPTPVGWRRLGPKGSRFIPAVGAIALVLLGFGTARRYIARRPSLAAERVVVAPFENRTADSGLDVLAGMTTDWLTVGIQHLSGLEVVSSRFALTSSSRLAEGRQEPQATAREVAEETGAGTVVSGAYYRRGDSLSFQAEIIDARNSRLVQGLAPVSGPLDRPTEVIDRLRQRVLGALALRFGAAAPPAAAGSPPTFEAYNTYLRGLNLANQFKYADAIPYLDSAVTLEPAFLGAWFTKADVHFTLAALLAATVGLGDQQVAAQFARGDSVVRYLAPLRGRMSAAQTYYLDWMETSRLGDLAGGLHALRRMVAVAPDPGSRWIEAALALRVNRPEEAIEALELDRHRAADWEPVTWLVPTEAYHMLGNHRRELREAQHARKRHPDVQLTHFLELLPLAALGQAEAVGVLLDKSLILPPQAGWWSYGSMAAVTALEFRAHGHSNAAGDVFRRSIAWYRKRAGAPDAYPFDRYRLARTLYWAGQWQEARDHVTRLLAESPHDLDYLGLAGVTAAREGDRHEALRVSTQLAAVARPYPLLGHPTLWRARIAALVGDPDQAVTLLRQAISEGLLPLDVAQGLGYAMWLHRDIDFEALRDYPPFEAILEVEEGHR